MEAKIKISYTKLLLITILSILFFNMVNDSSKFRWIMSVLTPLFTAFAMAYLLDPMVEFFVRKFSIKRGLSIFISLVIVIGVIVFLAMIGIPYLGNSITELYGLLSTYVANLYDMLDKLETSFDRPEVLEVTNKIRLYIERFSSSIEPWVSNIAPVLLNKAVSITMNIFGMFISFFMAIYMLIDKNDLLARMKRLLYAFRPKKSADLIIKTLDEANDIFSKFLVGKFIDSCIIGILCFVIMLVFNIPNGVLISIIIAITNMIPYFGPFIGAIPSIAITVIIAPIKAFWLLLIIFALQQFDGIYLGPKILGDRVGVRPFWILLAVTLGGKFMGIIGMLLGVPFVVLIKTILERNIELRLKLKNMDSFCEDKLHIKKEKFKKIKTIVVKR